MEPEVSLTQQPPAVPVSSQMVRVQLSLSISVLYSHLCQGLASGLFPSDFPTKTLYVCHICAFVIILKMITPVIFCKEYKSQSSSLCSLLQSPVTLSLLWTNISSTPYSWRPSAFVLPLMGETKFHSHLKNRQNYSSIYSYLNILRKHVLNFF